MQVRLATPSDYAAMSRWLKLKTEESYLTYVIPGVVGASLIMTAGKEFAFLNNLVTNPVVSRLVRQKAIDKLVAHILKVVDANEIRGLVAFSINESTMVRAEKFGFRRMPHTMIYRGV